MSRKKTLIFLMAFFGFCLFSTVTQAAFMPHPIQLYEKGDAILNAYRGDASQLDEAREIFAELINRFPNSPLGYLGMSRKCIIDAYLYDNFHNMKVIREQAMPFAIKALELGPSLRAAHEHYASLEQIFADHYSAQEEAKEHLSSFPDDAETYFIVANYLCRQNEYDKAIKYYNVSLGLEPRNFLRFRALKRIALIYLNEYKQPKKAIEYYTEALTIGNDPAINEYLGIAYLNAQEYKLSLNSFKKSQNAINNKSIQYYMLQAQGYLSEQEGRLEEAIAFLERASDYNKNNISLCYRLGELYYKVAKYDEAYRYFKNVIKLRPQTSQAYYFAGRAAHALGNKDKAIIFFQQVLQLDADSQEADWIRENIPELSMRNDTVHSYAAASRALSNKTE